MCKNHMWFAWYVRKRSQEFRAPLCCWLGTVLGVLLVRDCFGRVVVRNCFGHVVFFKLERLMIVKNIYCIYVVWVVVKLLHENVKATDY